jgi:hypothetical protein
VLHQILQQMRCVMSVPHHILWNAVIETSPFISMITTYGDQIQTVTQSRWLVSKCPSHRG